MTIYTDGTHLTADTLDELHQFAKSIGLKREWFQDHRHPHYDLKGSKRRAAIDAGAKLVGVRAMVVLSCYANAIRAGNRAAQVLRDGGEEKMACRVKRTVEQLRNCLPQLSRIAHAVNGEEA